jgi:hypothetical protein
VILIYFSLYPSNALEHTLSDIDEHIPLSVFIPTIQSVPTRNRIIVREFPKQKI